ncbi:helix-turn-helix transcriptional regulator [Embleya scabrispora]|uniref:helix-turn-helix transcriptional regulator n=1 Tax=Embleya scabrispora TaxID=159449 RepID=UPI00037CEC4A|nr:YafY family protein [Embleya scabrispora]MYS82316.1 WYL domain-containing protein [Streptomyces sp. SID5474]
MTAATPARLLGLLSLLQTPREWPGSELSARLGVSARTIRRDIERLRELGYPVEATRGADGGYRLVAGTAMPPLLLDDEEAVAIAVGLRTAAGGAVAGIEEASVRALAKLEQVLPSRLRGRVRAVSGATVPLVPSGPTVDPEALAVLAGAIANHEKVRFVHRAAGGAESRRLVEPNRLVSAGRRWYFVAWDVDRADWRTFRVDRMHEPRPTGARCPERSLPDPDAAAYVERTLHTSAPVHRADVTLYAPAEHVAARLGDALAGDAGPGGPRLRALDAGSCRLTGYADTLDWLALRLSMLGCEFEVHEPPELREHLRALGGRVTRAAGDPTPRTRPAPERSAPRPGAHRPSNGQSPPSSSRRS